MAQTAILWRPQALQWTVFLFALPVAFLLYYARTLYNIVCSRWFSSYRNLPHAPGKPLLADPRYLQAGEPWLTYFSTHDDTCVRYNTRHESVIVTQDLGFVSHLQQHIEDFEISTRLSQTVRTLGLRHGISLVRGAQRRRVKRSWEIAFSASAMKAHFPDILTKASLAVNRAAEIQGPVMMNGVLTRYVTEVARQCCFGRSSDANEDKPSEMEAVIRKFQQTRAKLGSWDMALPFNTARRRAYLRALRGITGYAWSELEAKEKEMEALHMTKEDMPKDVLSSMLSQSMLDGGKGSQTLAMAEIADNIPIMAIGSSDVNRIAQLFTLHMLAIHPDTQTKLYEHLDSLGPDPSFEELNIPFFDAVIEETMRFFQPYVIIERTATRNCVVPLHKPVKGKDGRTIEYVEIRKGTDVEIPTFCVNMDKSLYGPDADEFRPERFLDGTVSSHAKEMGFTWGSSTIFWGGGRGCPAFNFALATNKAIILAMIRSFVLSEPEGQTVVRTTQPGSFLINGTPSPDIPFICTPRQ